MATPPFNDNSDAKWSEVLELVHQGRSGVPAHRGGRHPLDRDMDYPAVIARVGSMDSGLGPGTVAYQPASSDVIMPPLNADSRLGPRG